MYCQKCGKQLPEGAKYCSKCGARVETTPASSGTDYYRKAKQAVSDQGRFSFAMPVLLRRLKVIALLAVSLLLISTSWIVTYGESSYDFSQYKGDIVTITEEIEDLAGWAGVEIDLSTARKIGLCIVDGRLSPRELFVLGKSITPLLDDIQETLEWWGEPEENIVWAKVLIYSYSALFWVCIVVGAVSILLTLIGSEMHIERLYTVLVIVLFCACGFLCVWSVEEIELQIRPTITSIASLVFVCVAATQRAKNDRLDQERLENE